MAHPGVKGLNVAFTLFLLFENCLGHPSFSNFLNNSLPADPPSEIIIKTNNDGL